MRKFLVYASVAAGIAAAYLMYRRGETPINIAKKTLTHPVGSLFSEVEQAVKS